MIVSGEVWAAIVTVGGTLLTAGLAKLWNSRADRSRRRRVASHEQDDKREEILDRLTREVDREARTAEVADRVARRMREERDGAQQAADEISRLYRACDIERDRLQQRIDVLTERLTAAGGDVSW